MTTEQVMFADDGWPEFASRLRAYVRRRVDPAWVDDVVGDILLRLVQHRAELGVAANPTAWVFTVAANALADHHRRRDAERRALARAGVEPDVVGSAVDDAESAIEFELSNCMRPMLQALPTPYGEALLLIEVDGLSQREAAQRLGLSFSGMKSRVQRARSKLKEALLRCCAVEVDRRGRVLDYTSRKEGCGTCNPSKSEDRLEVHPSRS